MAFVSKMFVGQDAVLSSAASSSSSSSASSASASSSVSDTVFVGFCRVFSGTISVGDELYSTPNFNAGFAIKYLCRHVLAPRYNPLTPDSSHHRFFLKFRTLHPFDFHRNNALNPSIFLQPLQNFASLHANGPRFITRFWSQ